MALPQSDPDRYTHVQVAPGVELATIPRLAGNDSVPFVLVHGLASNARLWDGVGERLQMAGHDSVAVDQRGHGRSAAATCDFDFATLSDDLAAVIRASFNRPVVLAGQSWGGNVVVEAARHHPDLVAGVVCVDGGFLKLSESFDSLDQALTALHPPPLAGTPLTVIRERMTSHFADFPPEGVEGQLANFEVRDDGTVKPWLSLDKHLEIIRRMWEHDPFSAAAELTVPVLVLAVGDPDSPRGELVSRLVAAAPDGRAEWMDAHHDVHAQEPDAVATLMTAFAGGLA
ncbi:MAG: alpha/beta hydrolase [Acidimicrobiia bacterium]|nr:alpha/beta hydrolase [Acidimicrobiia bacterium]